MVSVSLVKVRRITQHLFTFFFFKGSNIYDSGIELVLAFGELVKALDLNSGTVIVAKIINTAYCLFSIAHLHKKKPNLWQEQSLQQQEAECQSLNMSIYCLAYLFPSYDSQVILAVR